MGNTVPSAASVGSGAPPDARLFLQNELNKFIIQVGNGLGANRMDPGLRSPRRCGEVRAKVQSDKIQTIAVPLQGPAHSIVVLPFLFSPPPFQEQLSNSKFMKSYRCKVDGFPVVVKVYVRRNAEEVRCVFGDEEGRRGSEKGKDGEGGGREEEGSGFI